MPDTIIDYQPAFSAHVKSWDLVADGDPFETQHSVLFPVRCRTQAAFLKIHKPSSDEQDAYAVLDYFQGDGAARLLRHDSSAVLVERLDDDISLTYMVRDGKDAEATKIVAGVVASLTMARRKTPAPAQATPLEDRFRSLFWKAEQDKPARQAGNKAPSIYMRAATIARSLLTSPQEMRVLHGDIHHENILHDKGRGWLAIDPKGLVGERTYEVANMLCNPILLPDIVHNPKRIEAQARILADALDLDMRRLLRFGFAHACLSASWALEEGRDPAFRLTCAELIEKML